jgi:hypothetical protein
MPVAQICNPSYLEWKAGVGSSRSAQAKSGSFLLFQVIREADIRRIVVEGQSTNKS